MCPGQTTATIAVNGAVVATLSQNVTVGTVPNASPLSSIHNGKSVPSTFTDSVFYNGTILTLPNSHGITQLEWRNSSFPNEVDFLGLLPDPMINSPYVYGTIRQLGANFTNKNYARVEVNVRNQCGWSDWKTLEYLKPTGGGGPGDGDCPCTCPPGTHCPHVCDLVFTYSPNPVSNEILIDFQHLPTAEGKTEIYTVKLIDNMGITQRENRFLHRRKDGRTRSVRFNTSNLREGTYYLHIESNGEIRKEQIIIKRN